MAGKEIVFYSCSGGDGYAIDAALNPITISTKTPLTKEHAKQKADLFIVHSPICTKEFLDNVTVPVIIRDRIDGAQLAQARDFINHEAVKYVIKGYVFSNLDDYQKTTTRHFAKWEKPKFKIDVSKIKLGHGFGSYPKLLKIGSYLENKEYDLCFFGSVKKYRCLETKQNRLAAFNAIKNYSGSKHFADSKIYEHGEYLKFMAQSLATLSPFGYGEACYRDYEALYCGTYAIKPSVAHLDSLDGIFKINNLADAAKFDYSNLPKIMTRLKDRIQTTQYVLNVHSKTVKCRCSIPFLKNHYLKLCNGS